MAARFFLVVCASALLVQTITACSCLQSGAGALANTNLAAAELAATSNLYLPSPLYSNPSAAFTAANNLGYSYSSPPFNPGPIVPAPAVASASGGPFSVTLRSPYAPTGLDVVSTNNIEGLLEVIGSLPVFAAVTLDGNVASSGSAGTSYSCGNGNVGISSESLAAAGFGVGGAIANDVARAEIAGAQLANSAAGLAAYRPAQYGSGLNAGLNGGLGINAGLGLRPRPCGCGY